MTFLVVSLESLGNLVVCPSTVSHQRLRRRVAIFVSRPVMRVTRDFGIFGVTFVVLSMTSYGRFNMLTGMSMMRAASENRMQQHRRHRQNAGYVTEHRGLNRSAITYLRNTFGRVLRTNPDRHKPDRHLNLKSGKILCQFAQRFRVDCKWWSACPAD